MTSGIQTKYMVGDSFVARRRVIGGQRRIGIPAAFKGKGFKEISFEAKLEVGRRWKGDIVAVFEALQETTPFEMTKRDLAATGQSQKIQGVENLAQALSTLRGVGAEQIKVVVRKPRLNPGSFNFGPNSQSISIEATVQGILYDAICFVEFPEFGTKLGNELVFGKATLKRKLANWLLK